jgi:hypothetical protein
MPPPRRGRRSRRHRDWPGSCFEAARSGRRPVREYATPVTTRRAIPYLATERWAKGPTVWECRDGSITRRESASLEVAGLIGTPNFELHVASSNPTDQRGG